MNVGLPREIFIIDKPDIFALIALVYWDAVYMNVHCVVIRALLIWDSRSGIVAAEKVTLVSLAYTLGEPTFKQFGRSFI